MQLLLLELDLYVSMLILAAAGKALCNGGSPGPGLHTPLNTGQILLLDPFDSYEHVNLPEVFYAAY
mgnify:CR=1 FL=1